MVKMYWLLLICVGLHVSWTKIIVRKDAECAVPSKRLNLPQCEWHYIAYFPRIFRTGVTENVIFSTHGFPNDVVVNVELWDNNKKKITEVSREAKPGQLISVPLVVPHSASGNVKVLLQGIGKTNEGDMWRFSNMSEHIRVEKLGLTILIQTDRPIYKPGQLIRSRVVVVDSNLKPFNGKLETVSIHNPSDSIMRIWRDTQLVDGFASFDLKTSVKPVLGKWKIKVATQSYKKDLSIEVQKYVLPKFQVVVLPPSFLSKMMKKITVEVCAKYSYGKPVIGKLLALVCLKMKHSYYSRRLLRDESPTCSAVVKPISGCTKMDINLDSLRNSFKQGMKKMKSRYYYSDPNIYATFNASVKEGATGVTINSKEVTKHILAKDVTLTIESKDVFKPGFPLSIKVKANYPDGNRIQSLIVKLTATCRGVPKELFRDKKVHILNGVKEIRLPTIPFSAKNLYIRVQYMRSKLNPTESNWKRTSSADKMVQPWYSPSHSYLNLHKVEAPVQIGSPVRITVGYTSVDTSSVERKITYSMMCGGNLVKSGTFSRTFISAAPYMTSPPTTTTTTTTTTRKNPRNNKNYTLLMTPPPIFLQRQLQPIWWESKATRPPMPYQFSTGTFSFTVDVERKMLPSCSMVVYYVREEEVVADQTDIEVINEFENQISMKFDQKEVRPGNSVKLTVKGAPNSRIAVAAVDKSIHFLAKGNDIKTKDLLDIRNKLTISPGYSGSRSRCGPSWYYEKREFVDSEKAFTNVGAIFLTSLRADVRPCEAHPPVYESIADGGPDREEAIPMAKVGGPVRKSKPGKKKSTKKTRARTEFPETWLWTDERLSENGVRVFDVKVPDSITTWYASGFGLSQSAGLGVADPALLRAFQPFFISLTLPYSVVRDEDVTIPAAVFSYLKMSCMSVKVTLQYSHEYRMVAGPSAKTCLCSGRTATVLFRIRPKKLGKIKIRIGAETLADNLCANRPSVGAVNAADILERELLVEPEGIKEEYTRSTYFCPNTSPTKKFTTNIKLKLPDNLVPGSIFAKVTAMGDIMGSSLSNIDSLLAMPYGCGEQNMLKFAPNIFIMNYLNNTNQVTSEIETKALDYMRTGYQRELTYKHDDGAYSAFGNRDKEGSTWLTAFVLKSYAQARPWIDIDEKEVKQTSKWLMNIQGPDGCFPKIGTLHHKAMKGGVKTPATLTAYVLISLLEAGYSRNHPSIVSASECVSTVFETFKVKGADSYSLSIMAYLFAKMRSPFYEDAIKYLDDKAISEDGMLHWEEPQKEKDPQPISYYHKARSTDIEQTAYVLLAKLEYGGKKAISLTVPIVKWLSKQRNSLGGWSSTQDTVLAMQALAEFAERTFSGDANMDVSVNADGFDHMFNINSNNKLVLQRVEKIPVPSTLKITGEGVGCALIQTNVKYNVIQVKEKPTFSVYFKIKSVDMPLTRQQSCRSQILQVCATWLGKEESNMAIIDVQMISGFEADQETFEKIRLLTRHLKEIEVKEKSVMFYFSRIGNISQCVTFRVDQTNNVRKTKPAPIKVYDYYDTGKSATVMYSFTKDHCVAKKKSWMP